MSVCGKCAFSGEYRYHGSDWVRCYYHHEWVYSDGTCDDYETSSGRRGAIDPTEKGESCGNCANFSGAGCSVHVSPWVGRQVLVTSDDWCDYWKQDSSRSESSNCYIATATLNAPNRADILAQMREWRAKRLRPFRLGQWLERVYDTVGPRVVSIMNQQEQVRQIYHRWLIMPVVQLLQRRNTSKIYWLYDVLGYCVFICILIIGIIHTRIVSQHDRH